MTKILTAIILTLAVISCSQTKQSSDKDKIDKVCDKFMQTFAEGKTNDALLLLKQNTVMSTSTIDTLRVTIADQINRILPAYGKMLSSEFITERKIKDLITKRFYILKFEKYYLKFDFTLYKSASGWTVTNFTYDDGLIELLY